MPEKCGQTLAQLTLVKHVVVTRTGIKGRTTGIVHPAVWRHEMGRRAPLEKCNVVTRDAALLLTMERVRNALCVLLGGREGK